MKQTLSRDEAAYMLMNDKWANWTLAGARALIDYLEYLEEAAGEYIEFDRVALRCEWTEYASSDEALEDYGLDSFVELDEATTVLALDSGGLVVQQF